MTRVHDKPLLPDETEMWYVQDLPNGKIQVSCNNCQELTTESERCPKCQKWFVYRPWWEW